MLLPGVTKLEVDCLACLLALQTRLADIRRTRGAAGHRASADDEFSPCAKEGHHRLLSLARRNALRRELQPWRGSSSRFNSIDLDQLQA